MKKLTGFKHKCFFLAAAVIILSNGCSLNTGSYSKTLVLTVDDSKIYMDEMMYHVMLAAMQGELYAEFAGKGKDYWDMKNEDGSTMREAMKNMALENAVKYQLFYELALQEGYTLTDEEKQQSRSKADNIMSNMGEEQIKSVGLTKEKLTGIQDKIAVAAKYYNDFVKRPDVDEEAIKSTFKLSDYKEYDIEYIYAGKGERTVLASLLEKAKTAGDFTVLTEGTVLNAGKLSFLEGKDTFGEESGLEDVIKTMEAGEVSDILETVKGYYIIKLTDNTSTGKYDAAVKNAVDGAREEAIDTAYETLKKKHKIGIQEHVWNRVDIEKAMINSISTGTGITNTE